MIAGCPQDQAGDSRVDPGSAAIYLAQIDFLDNPLPRVALGIVTEGTSMHGTHSPISGQDEARRFCVMATNIATGERRLLADGESKEDALAICEMAAYCRGVQHEFYTVEPEAQR